MDDDVEEGKNARLCAVVDVTGAEGHGAICKGSGLELGVAIANPAKTPLRTSRSFNRMKFEKGSAKKAV